MDEIEVNLSVEKVLKALSIDFQATKDIAKKLSVPKTVLNKVLYKMNGKVFDGYKVVKECDEGMRNPRWALVEQ